MTKRQERSWQDENKEADGGGNEKIGEEASEKESAVYTAYWMRWPARRNGKMHTTKHTTAQIEKGRVNKVRDFRKRLPVFVFLARLPRRISLSFIQ